MRLNEALREECVCAGVDVPDKAAALLAVARCAKESPILAGVDEQQIVADLDKRRDIMVAIQDLFYAAGSLTT